MLYRQPFRALNVQVIPWFNQLTIISVRQRDIIVNWVNHQIFKMSFWRRFINRKILNILSLIFILRLERPDAKRFVRPSLTWDLTTSASWEAYREILNCPIMTAMGNPLRSTTDLGNPRPRTTRSRLLPNPLFLRQRRGSIFMPERCFLSASYSSTLSTGLYIYDEPFPFV